VRRDDAHEVLAFAGARDRGNAVLRIGAGADGRRIADAARELVVESPGRGGRGEVAVDVEGDGADRAVLVGLG
jgi:hypothetical protein